AVLAQSVTQGSAISATATDPSGNTSEFSADIVARLAATLNGSVSYQARGGSGDSRWVQQLSVKLFQPGTNNLVLSAGPTTRAPRPERQQHDRHPRLFSAQSQLRARRAGRSWERRSLMN